MSFHPIENILQDPEVIGSANSERSIEFLYASSTFKKPTRLDAKPKPHKVDCNDTKASLNASCTRTFTKRSYHVDKRYTLKYILNEFDVPPVPTKTKYKANQEEWDDIFISSVLKDKGSAGGKDSVVEPFQQATPPGTTFPSLQLTSIEILTLLLSTGSNATTSASTFSSDSDIVSPGSPPAEKANDYPGRHFTVDLQTISIAWAHELPDFEMKYPESGFNVTGTLNRTIGSFRHMASSDLLHHTEVDLANTLGLKPQQFHLAKKRILAAAVYCIREKKSFSRVEAAFVYSSHRTKAWRLFKAFEAAGWFRRSALKSYL